MKWILAVFVLISALDLAQADPVRSHLPPARWNFFHRLNSSFMQVVEEGNPYFEEDRGDYPWLAKIIQFDLFKWNPSGKAKRNISNCDPEIWQKEFLSHRQSASDSLDELDRFLLNCQFEWETNFKDPITNALGTVSLKLHPNRHPYARHVVFNLPNSIKIKGLLALKTDQKKRPLVIFRTGLFSNTQEFFPERFLFMQLFEESPFHVLVLESSTGAEFLKHNTSYSLGGFDEGLQNFLIAQKLQDPNEPLSRHIQSVHMMGMSLGGHSVMMSALLNQLNPGAQGQPVVKSVLAFCPLLNMQDTLDYHMSQGFSMDIMNYWASRRLKAVKERIPGIQDSQFIPQFFSWIQSNYKAPLIAENGAVKGINLPPEVQNMIEKEHPEDLFWKLNHFWPWYQNIKTPVFIFSTRKDPIVSWFINAGRIEDKRMKFEGSDLREFSFESGYHCSLPMAYDWGSLSTIFQSYFLKFSPELEFASKELRTPLSEAAISEISNRANYFLDVSFDVTPGTAGVLATIRFDQEMWPDFSSRYKAPKMKVQLPLSEMEFPIEQIVRDRDEANLLRRWAYRNIHARIDKSDLVLTWKVTK